LYEFILNYFRHTGHVAIITAASATYVRIAEQNWDDKKWPSGQDYGRELPVRVEEGKYFILENYILGWIRYSA
jgi:glutathionylspermidine amidase/synthetase